MIDRARLERIVREAGQIALACWPGHGHALKTWEKEPGNPVSEADLAVDQFLKRELGALLPSAGWLSEETVDAPERLAVCVGAERVGLSDAVLRAATLRVRIPMQSGIDSLNVAAATAIACYALRRDSAG
jgi:3'-phosphoadenosine 5'-phosphosulfate (PAPS) 3'-phosphatase